MAMAMATASEVAYTLGPEAGSNDVDERTVFVRSLPFTLLDSQLEDYFGEVGPVRNCFTVKEKGAELHRGFGFVQFAVAEDAHRAVDAKNGATLQGRKIKVELAKRRAPLDQRRPKVKDEQTEKGIGEPSADLADKLMKKRKLSDVENTQPNIVTPQEAPREGKKLKHGERKGRATISSVLQPERKKRPREEGKASDSQRSARTIVVGGLENSKMVQFVIGKSKKLGSVEEVRNPLDDAELISRGLAKDGCKQGTIAITYRSVKEACQAVAALHKQIFGGSVVWARQLGGEGSKLKKWRLIIRNLPFMLKEQTLRELFSPSGFVWDITIPRKPDSSSKGFAFVGFTCRADAEKAIKGVNGKLVGKRPVAVDWAMAKKEYETLVAKSAPSEEGQDKMSDRENDDTASEDEDEDEDEREEYSGEGDFDQKAISKTIKKVKIGGSEKPQLKKPVSRAGEQFHKEDSDLEEEDESESNKSMSEDDDRSPVQSVDAAQEKELLKRILDKVVKSSKEEEVTANEATGDPDSLDQRQTKEAVVLRKNSRAPEVTGQSDKKFEKRGGESSQPYSKEDSLKRTVFVRNLPLDAKVQDMRRRFSAFGEVKSFRMVLHPSTKQPKGTAFLEFASADGAEAAVATANGSGDGEEGGMVVGGRKLALNLALNRDQAKSVAKQMSKEQEDHDRRHLKLAKEGLIQEGTPAAEGLSKGDLMKRKHTEHEKATKLRSPNFHLSTTRLSVHNIPKDMSEKDLKQLVIKAVKSRASKQQPVVKQVKILRDEVKGVPGSGGRSRGSAFVEFTEHQHALVALRVLNNNPETFGAENRPIIEFAIENSQILRKRAARVDQAKSRLARKGPAGKVAGLGGVESGVEKKTRKRRDRKSDRNMSEMKDRTAESIARANPQEQEGGRPGKKRKREKKGDRKTADRDSPPVERKTLDVGSEPDGVVAVKGKKMDRNKRQKRVQVRPATDPGVQRIERSGNVGGQVDKVGMGEKTDSRSQALKAGKQRKNSEDEVDGRPQQSHAVKCSDLQEGKNNQNGKPSTGGPKVKAPREESRRERRHPQAVDKLDQLVAQYRTKYFSAPPESKTRGATGDLQRWFD